MKLIAITGGIGSGKSVVARIVKVMGYQVYDCDSRARALMIHDESVRSHLIAEFGPDVYHADGSPNRQHLSTVAFSDNDARLRLNAIVHPATARDIRRWAASISADDAARFAFVETAILRTSGLDKLVDEVWHVTAPTDVRIQRVMARNGLSEQQVRDRMAAQSIEDVVAAGEQVIVNDNITPVLPQVTRLLNTMSN